MCCTFGRILFSIQKYPKFIHHFQTPMVCLKIPTQSQSTSRSFPVIVDWVVQTVLSWYHHPEYLCLAVRSWASLWSGNMWPMWHLARVTEMAHAFSLWIGSLASYFCTDELAFGMCGGLWALCSWEKEFPRNYTVCF